MKRTGAPYGELDGWIKPLARNSATLAFSSANSIGENLELQRYTTGAPSSKGMEFSVRVIADPSE
jgi:hypothetical protein